MYYNNMYIYTCTSNMLYIQYVHVLLYYNIKHYLYNMNTKHLYMYMYIQCVHVHVLLYTCTCTIKHLHVVYFRRKANFMRY